MASGGWSSCIGIVVVFIDGEEGVGADFDVDMGATTPGRLRFEVEAEAELV